MVLARTRQAGIVPQSLCYHAVVAVPGESALTGDDISSILRTFRVH
jgi:hypothetical protein